MPEQAVLGRRAEQASKGHAPPAFGGAGDRATALGCPADGTPATVASETAFLVDFLPVIRRTLTRTGFVVGHVQYYCDALKPWIARREQLGRFVLRRDPVTSARSGRSTPTAAPTSRCRTGPCRGPPVSAWEQKAAVDRRVALKFMTFREAMLP
jgi:hypothetical protein